MEFEKKQIEERKAAAASPAPVQNSPEEQSPKEKKKAAKAAAKKEKERQKAESREKKAQEKKRKKAEKKAKNAGKITLGKIITDGAAGVIFFHDRVQAKVDRFFGAMWYSIVYEVNDVRTRYKQNTSKMLSEMFGTIVVICMMLLVFDHEISYQYSYNGRILGYVNDQEQVYNILDIAGKKLSEINQAKVKFSVGQNITFKKVSASNKDIDTADQALNKLTYMTEIDVAAYGIYEDDRLCAVVESQQVADNVLQDVIHFYRNPDSGMTVKSIKFKNKVEVKPVNVMLTSVMSQSEAEEMLEKGGTLDIQHIVMEDETASDIQKSYTASAGDIKILSTDTDEDNLMEDTQAGDNTSKTSVKKSGKSSDTSGKTTKKSDKKSDKEKIGSKDSSKDKAESKKIDDNTGNKKVDSAAGKDNAKDSNSTNTRANASAAVVTDETADSTNANAPESGDRIEIQRESKPITVTMTESGTMSEVIQYKTIEKKTKSMYRGDREVTQKGVNGRQTITGTLVFENGKEVKRNIKSQEVLKKSVDKIVLVGTNDKPKWYPTGKYIIPVKNEVITSYFGSRWGRIHGGLDFGMPIGTPIYASDGGTVSRASYFAGYGLCVEVTHNNGTFTRYGHCSKVVVKVGDKVAQGEKIAEVGNTGNSTGPHLHFEIHPKGGEYVDPYPYLYGSNKGNQLNNE